MVKSIKAKFSRLLFLFISFVLFCCLIGCGNSGDSGTDTGSNTTTLTPSLTLSVPSSVTFGTPVTATATLRDGSGALINGAVVTFSATSGLVAFTPVSASALTTAGIASVSLNAAGPDSAGATSIMASATFTSGGTTSTVTSSPVGITVNGATVTLGTITLGQPSISAYGTSSVNVPVLIDGLAATVPISVTFTSSCVTSGKATLTSPVTNNIGTGIATSTYKDNNCNSGTDVITASVSGGAHASTTITVIPPATNNIQFVSATPSIIGTSTASSSSLPTSSLVKFRVVDSSNNGKSGVGVTFSVIPNSYASLGISFTPASATSDTDGYVTTSLSSGTIPTPVWVVATVNGTSLTSQSNTLTITTGLPTQDFFSLSVQTYNIEGWNYDGTKSNLMIIASDRLGNPVPDGTAINFITEGAQIAPASCTTSAGTCSVIFTSAASRPADGRVTILAYAIGEKSFIDSTINNRYDSGETFYDIGDPYIDANENGIWDSGEFTIASTTSGSSACRTQPGATALPSSYGTFPNGMQNYVPSAPSKENTCTGTWGQNYVRRSVVLVLSGSSAYISPSTVDMASTCSQTFGIILTDVNGNPMPAGTKIAVSSSNVNYIANGATSQSAASSSIPGGTPVMNTNHAGGTTFGLTVQADCSAGNPVSYPTGSLYLNVTTPNGIGTTIPVTVISTSP